MSPFRRTVRLYVSVFFKAGQTYDQPRLFPNVAGAGNGAFSARQPVTDVTGRCSAESGEEFDFPGVGMVIVGIVREDFIRQDLFRIGCPHHAAHIPAICRARPRRREQHLIDAGRQDIEIPMLRAPRTPRPDTPLL